MDLSWLFTYTTGDSLSNTTVAWTDKVSAIAAVFGAVATFIACIIALFKEWFISKIYKPSLLFTPKYSIVQNSWLDRLDNDSSEMNLVVNVTNFGSDIADWCRCRMVKIEQQQHNWEWQICNDSNWYNYFDWYNVNESEKTYCSIAKNDEAAIFLGKIYYPSQQEDANQQLLVCWIYTKNNGMIHLLQQQNYRVYLKIGWKNFDIIHKTIELKWFDNVLDNTSWWLIFTIIR